MGINNIEKYLRANLPYDLFQIIIYIIAGIIIFGFLCITALFLIWLERKIAGHIQSRLGPMYAGGFHGWAQTIADAIKLLVKEDIVPKNADKIVHFLAPVIIFLPCFILLSIIPYDSKLIISDLNIGIIFFFAISSFSVYAIVMGGWGSNNKYTLMGALRSAAQVVSYEVPYILSAIGVIMISESMRLKDIVEAQKNMWFIVYQPIGFLIFLIAGLAEVNRTPFDIPEAESELVAGFHTEYSGMKFALFFLAEYGNLFLVSSMITTLFLGGWLGPILPPIVWFFIKTYAIIFFYMWARWTLPRFRVDRLMLFSWKVLIPIAFANIIVTGIVISII
jgi:NADH-quinone oxidoreductase subunit H